MKKIVFLFIFSLLFTVSFSQKRYFTPANDTVKADTNYIPSANGFKHTISGGSVSYTFTHTDVADSLSYARLEWSDNQTTWTALTGNAALGATTTNGQSKIYASNPLIHLYYRAAIACATGDTVAITGQIFMIKEEE